MRSGSADPRVAAARSPTGRAIAALALALGATLLVTLVSLVVRLAVGDTLQQAVHATASLHARLLRVESATDSWGAMFSAQTRLAARAQRPAGESPDESLYAQTLRLDRCKFQYPPSALLLLDLLPSPGIDAYQCESDDPAQLRTIYGEHWPAKRWIDVAARAAVFGTLVVAACVLQALLVAAPASGARPARRGQVAALWALTLLAGLLFYPLIQAYKLGQLQVFLNLFVALALLAVLKGRPFVAGLLIGVCVLVKPQLVLLLVWALLRREAAFARGLLIVGVAGHAWAWWRYGTALHLDYLRTLAALSQHGEVFWPNQSVNGLLNRFLENGDPRTWSFRSFPPYHPLVRWATLVSSLAITAAALWFGRRRDGSTGRALDFAAMAAAATLASPIAWEHHYGVFFVFMALAAGAALTAGPRPRPGLLVAVGLAYLLMANALLVPDALFMNRWVGLLASHLWLGGMLSFAVLLVLLQPDRPPAPVRADG